MGASQTNVETLYLLNSVHIDLNENKVVLIQ